MEQIQNYALTACRRWSRLFAAAVLLFTAAVANAIDLTPFVVALTPASYGGLGLSYDSNLSETDQVFFDANGQLTIPAFELNDYGAVAALFVWVNGSASGTLVWQGNDPSACLAALTASGFTVNTSGSGGLHSDSGSALNASDQANLRGLYQVALWIFGAVLMLPIILKVKPS